MDDKIVITPEIAAYTAGLMERANFTMKSSFTAHRGIRHIPYFVDIRLYQLNTSQAEWLAEIWNIKIRKKPNKTTGSLTAYVSSKVAENMLHHILPYLIKRRSEAMILYTYLEAKKLPIANRKSEDYAFFYKALQDIKGANDTGYKNKVSRGIAAVNKRKVERLYKKPKTETYYNNIFDLFDGTLSMEDSRMAKSIFDDLIPKDK